MLLLMLLLSKKIHLQISGPNLNSLLETGLINYSIVNILSLEEDLNQNVFQP